MSPSRQGQPEREAPKAVAINATEAPIIAGENFDPSKGFRPFVSLKGCSTNLYTKQAIAKVATTILIVPVRDVCPLT